MSVRRIRARRRVRVGCRRGIVGIVRGHIDLLRLRGNWPEFRPGSNIDPIQGQRYFFVLGLNCGAGNTTDVQTENDMTRSTMLGLAGFAVMSAVTSGVCDAQRLTGPNPTGEVPAPIEQDR